MNEKYAIQAGSTKIQTESCPNGTPLLGAARRLRAGNFAIQREILRNTGQPPDIVKAGRVRILPEKPNLMNEGVYIVLSP
ncbi:hypothetical protein [Desulfatirhabdium butyrativorans]|uniref:hypothetical protein n=1 Tax=Desulfatirhabdium butyrativorans TaxID=340467 RepID=UPI00040F45B0|nr:hypothetical protein [Desulfatirhabdium butyrativorans]